MRYILFSLMLLPFFVFATQDPLIVEVDTAIQILTRQQQHYQDEVNSSVSQPQQTKNFNGLMNYPGLSAVKTALDSNPQAGEANQNTNQELVRKIDTIQTKIQKLKLVKMNLENQEHIGQVNEQNN